MIITHKDKTPRIDSSVYIAPNATICGDVIVGAGARILFGACVIAEGQTLEIGQSCIVMENAVIRTTDEHPTIVGAHSLIGPHAHLAGCTLEECVFIATGVSVTKMKGQEGAIFARTFIHSIVLTLLLGALIAVQQYLIPWVIPGIGG